MGHGLAGVGPRWHWTRAFFWPLFYTSIFSDFCRVMVMLWEVRLQARRGFSAPRALGWMTLVYAFAGLTETPAAFRLTGSAYVAAHAVAHAFLGVLECKFWDRACPLIWGARSADGRDRCYAGRVAVVTGASSGIGLDIARALSARGAAVVAVALPGEGLRDTLRDRILGGHDRDDGRSNRGLAIEGDLSDPAFVATIVPRAVERFGRVDILVNNAGMSKHKPAFRLTRNDVRAVTQVNFLAAASLALDAVGAMLAAGRGGAIVNVSSFAADCVPPREASYAASKAALRAFTVGLWHDLQGTGIHAANVLPGPVDTAIWTTLEETTGNHARTHKWPPSLVTAAVLECVEERRFEVVAPRTAAMLFVKWLRVLAPIWYRAAMRAYDPIPPAVLAEAVAVANQQETTTKKEKDA